MNTIWQSFHQNMPSQLLWDILSDYLILMHSESRTNSINTPSWHVLHNQPDTWFGWMNKTWLFPRDWLSTLVLRCGWEKKMCMDIKQRWPAVLGFPAGLFRPGKSREGPGTGRDRTGPRDIEGPVVLPGQDLDSQKVPGLFLKVPGPNGPLFPFTDFEFSGS